MAETVSLSHPTRINLRFLDSLRGLAALYVVLNHAYGHMIMGSDYRLSPGLRAAYHAVLYGHFAVDLFIVLSGYCLMLPVAQAGDLRLTKGFTEYIKRRAWRILPPYYVSIALALMIRGILVILRDHGIGMSSLIPIWTWGGLAAHLALVHNLNIAWDGQINGVLWSVGTEWQIYFVFPLLLLPLWRRFGLGIMFGVALAASWVPYAIYRAHAFQGACPWYVALFACGMIAAQVGFSPTRSIDWCVKIAKWPPLAAVSMCAAIVSATQIRGPDAYAWSDLLFGMLAAICLAAMAARCDDQNDPHWLVALKSRPLVTLGAFSYSVYLVHDPVLSIFRAFIPFSIGSPTLQFLVIIPAEAAVAVTISYLFSLAFEQPFLRRRDVQ